MGREDLQHQVVAGGSMSGTLINTVWRLLEICHFCVMEKTSNKHQHFTEIHSAASSNLVFGTSKSFKIPQVSSENFPWIFLHIESLLPCSKPNG